MANNSVTPKSDGANATTVPTEPERTRRVLFGAWSSKPDVLFSVNAGAESIDALSHADLFTGHVRRMLQGAMEHDRESGEVAINFDDVMVMDFLLDMAHACRTAAGAVA